MNMKKVETNIIMPKKCSVAGCNGFADILLNNGSIARCVKCYSQEVSDYKNGKYTPKVVGRFRAEKDIMDTLEKLGLVQGQNETLREFAIRCRKYSLQNQAGLLPSSISAKFGMNQVSS